MGCPVEDGSGAELIVAYSARTLAPDREAEFERHLALCAKCRELAEAQRKVWLALDAWRSITVSSNFDERLFQRIANEEKGARWSWLPGNWSWRAAAPVGVACAALIAAFLLKNPVLPESQSQSQPKLQIEQVEHALDDMEMLKQLGVGI
jgi:anti-sigma factor RsiW